MSFSFRNLFSQGDEENPAEGGEKAPENAASGGGEGHPGQPFFNSQGKTGEGNFQAMFDQQAPQMPLMGGSGSDPRGIAPSRGLVQEGPKNVCNYLASELLAFIPPALAAQGGIPMEQTIPLEMPANGSSEIRLSAICQACPALFATEITPLNDSVITLPPKPVQQVPQSPASNPFGQQQPGQNPPAASGIDIASMRQQSGGSPFSRNPFADAAQSELYPAATPQAPAQSNPFADASARNAEQPAQPPAMPSQQAPQQTASNPFADASQHGQQAQPRPGAAQSNPFGEASQQASAPQPSGQANPFADAGQQAAQQAAASQKNPFSDEARDTGQQQPPAQSNPFADASRGNEAGVPSPANLFSTEKATPPQQTPSQFGFSAPAKAPREDSQSSFSPFGAPQQPAESKEPSGATPSVGFSAIGKFGEGEGQQPRPRPEESIFPAGNPFESDGEPFGENASGGGGSSFFSLPEQEKPASNPFGGEGSGAKPQEPAKNPFESEASFSTIFSEKAHEDKQMPAPGAPQHHVNEDLPTLDEALPPLSGSNPFAFKPTETSAEPANDPFAPLKPSGQEAETPKLPTAEHATPAPEPKPDSQPQPPSPWGMPQSRESREEASPSVEPAAPKPESSESGAAQLYQRSPFDHQEETKVSKPEPTPEPAEQKESQEPVDEDNSSDNFDDLSPFTAAVSSGASFFDELEREAAEKKNREASAAAEQEAHLREAEKAARPEPEPELKRQFAPAPADSVVKNIELRAVFGSNEDFDVETIARKTVSISGIVSCAIRTPYSTTQASRSGESAMSESQIEGLAENARQIAQITGVGDAGAFTMHTDKGLISIFNHDDVVLAVRHSAGEFDPGVREKLMLITRGVAAL